MFCDLVGSTALSSRLDPEDLRSLIGAYHRCCAEVIERAGGFVAKYMGDGVLAYFGYPAAHEDDAERAVRAGLGLIQAMQALNSEPPLQTRIGIATGLVVVGDVIGEGAAQEQAVVGETPNLAARLQAFADRDTVIIAETTRRQIGGLFEVTDLGLQSLKGFSEPQPAWQVISENRALGRFEALRSGVTALIGREEELALLRRRWAQAKEGEGRVVLIGAEPGIGKSRLVAELAQRIGGEPHIRLRCFCSPQHQDSAFYPVIAQMERAAGFARDDTNAQRLAKLQALLAATTPTREDLALIADLLSVPSPDLAPVLDGMPGRRRQGLLQVLLRQIERLSRRHPMLMVFEDVHWVDPSTRELLDHMMEQVERWPVLLLVTYRPEFHPPWSGQPHVATLALTRLSRGDTAAMVANIAGVGNLASATVEEIAERADGVPLFVEELTKAVQEAGGQGTAALSATPAASMSIPATLHTSLMARLDRLGPAAREIAQKGAAIGRGFDYELLASIVDSSEVKLREALRQLADAGLVIARGVPPQCSYTFKHALVQDAAYSTLLRDRRQDLHARIGEVLEKQFPETLDTQPEILAQHFTRAGRSDRAVELWLKAGQQALARSTMVEAESLLRQALDALTDVPESGWRCERELDLQAALGWALTATKGYGAPEAGAALARASVLAAHTGRAEHLIPLSTGQWAFHLNKSEHKLALQVAEQLENMGEAGHGAAAQLQGRRMRGFNHCMLGNLIEARRLLEGSVDIADPAHRTIRTQTSEDPYCDLLGHLAITLGCLGYIDQAQYRLDEALSEARRLNHHHTLALVLSFSTWIDHLTRSRESKANIEELLARSREQGFPMFVAIGTAKQAHELIALGQASEGLSLLNQALTVFRAAGTVMSTPILLIWMAEGQAQVGQMPEALKRLAEAAQIIETTEERVHEAELHRVRGDLLIATGEHSAAEQSYRQALAVAERQSAKLFELRAATSLTRLWRDQGKRMEAHNLLAPIYAWFTEGFGAPDMKDAKALLDEL